MISGAGEAIGQPPTMEEDWAYQRVRLCQLFTGWTLRDVDDLSAADLRDVWAVIAAQKKFKPKVNWFS